MSINRFRLMIIVTAVAVATAVALWWVLPRVVSTMPGRLRHYVPEALIERVTTPLPTALPAPTIPAPELLELALAAPSPPPSPMATITVAPGPAPNPDETATPAPPPTIAPPTAVPSPTGTPLPAYVRIEGLPIIPQKFNNCGPTNLTITLNHFGVEVDQFDVAAVVRPNYEDRNVSPGELAGFVNERTDLAATAYVGGEIDTLRRLIALGFPVIIEKGLEPDATTGWMGHYLTVFGYDDSTAQFLVRDTYLGPWREDGLAGYAETERYWAQFNGTFIVVHTPERAGELAEALGPGMSNPAAMWAAAAERARATIRAAPDDPFAWFNLGTSLTEIARLGAAVSDYESAAAAYDQARLLGLPPRMLWYQFGPYEAYLARGRYADVLALVEATSASQGGRNVEETYFYQGLALRMAGDDDGSRAAFERAIALNPQSPTGVAAAAALELE